MTRSISITLMSLLLVTASAFSEGVVLNNDDCMIEWDPSAGAVGYRLYADTQPSSPKGLKQNIGPSTKTTCKNAQLTASPTGQQWYIELTAYNAQNKESLKPSDALPFVLMAQAPVPTPTPSPAGRVSVDRLETTVAIAPNTSAWFETVQVTNGTSRAVTVTWDDQFSKLDAVRPANTQTVQPGATAKWEHHFVASAVGTYTGSGKLNWFDSQTTITVIIPITITVGAISPAPPLPPDRDGDGVADETDQCPDIAGVALSGCPPLTPVYQAPSKLGGVQNAKNADLVWTPGENCNASYVVQRKSGAAWIDVSRVTTPYASVPMSTFGSREWRVVGTCADGKRRWDGSSVTLYLNQGNTVLP